jgi:hypothetical protein
VATTKKWLCMLKTHILIHRLLSNSGDEFKTQLCLIQKAVAEQKTGDSREQTLFSIRNWQGLAELLATSSTRMLHLGFLR